jgi:hypothetical protein
VRTLSNDVQLVFSGWIDWVRRCPPQLGDSGRRWILQNPNTYTNIIWAPATDRKNACTCRRCARRPARSINLSAREGSHRGIKHHARPSKRIARHKSRWWRRRREISWSSSSSYYYTRVVHLARHCWCMQHQAAPFALNSAGASGADRYACMHVAKTTVLQRAHAPSPSCCPGCETRCALVRLPVTHTRSSPAYVKHMCACVCMPPCLYSHFLHTNNPLMHASSLLASQRFPSQDLSHSYIWLYISIYIQQQHQQQHSLLSQASWSRLEMKPKRDEKQGDT